MFSNDRNDLILTLSQMHDLALRKSNFNQAKAKEDMREFMSHDRRLDGFDQDRLIDHVHRTKYNGAHLDLDDPQLKKGGQPRPLDRWR
jgi:hypothetical protein